MATPQMTCYIAVCDSCAQELETDYIVHHATPGDAIGYATDHDWVVVGGWLYCDHCQEGKGVSCASCDNLVEREGDRCRACQRQELES